MNKLVTIGETSNVSCYLNITKEEAVSRYLKANNLAEVEDFLISEFEFEDEFAAYEVYPLGLRGLTEPRPLITSDQ